MNRFTVIIFICIGFLVAVIFSVVDLLPLNQENNARIEAQKMIDFQNTKHSCGELKRLYLQYYKIKYNSFTNADWYNEVRSKLIDGCINGDELYEIEFIEMCKDSHVMGCEISKIKYPEKYENFEFLTALNTALAQQNFTEVGMK